MATDGSEISFVRCRSCSSLVPALSTRCRMCGATLEASAKVEEDKDPRRTSRVRQRTMSEQSPDVSSAIERLREEHDAEPTVQAPPPPPRSEPRPERKAQPTMVTDAVTPEILGDQGARFTGHADPLQAYIEEVESPSEGGMVGEGASHADRPFAMPMGAPPVGESQDETPSPTISENGNSSVGHSATPSGSFSAPPAPSGGTAPRESESGPRVIVESGNRRGRGGLSFGRPRESVKPDTREMESVAPSGRPNVRASEERQEQPPAPRSAPAPERTRPEPVVSHREPPRMEEEAASTHERTPRPTPQVVNSPSPTRVVKGARADFVPSAGRLAGWLVSYRDDEDGSAIELREGRFFVTGRSLKPHDLVLDDESISTPHALVVVDGSGKVRVQDLLSEQGIFMRRRGSDDYERCEEYAEIHHGEWVRFGEVEFLVSLIPYVGTK